VPEQPARGTDLGRVKVQFGDVACTVGVLGDDLAGNRTAVRGLPLRRAGGRLHEGVVDATAQVRVDAELGERERAVRLRGARVDLGAHDHRLLQRGNAAGGDRVRELVQLGANGTLRRVGAAQLAVEITRVRAQRGKQGRVGHGHRAGCGPARRRLREQRHHHRAVHPTGTGVDGRLRWRTNSAPRHRIAERVALNPDQLQRPAGHRATAHLVAAFQARDQHRRCSGRVARHCDPSRLGYVGARGRCAHSQRRGPSRSRQEGADPTHESTSHAANHVNCPSESSADAPLLGFTHLVRRGRAGRFRTRKEPKLTAVALSQRPVANVWCYVAATNLVTRRRCWPRQASAAKCSRA